MRKFNNSSNVDTLLDIVEFHEIRVSELADNIGVASTSFSRLLKGDTVWRYVDLLATIKKIEEIIKQKIRLDEVYETKHRKYIG